MTKNELNNKYFNWMYQLVCNGKYYRKLSHRKLLAQLHSIDFSYMMTMDSNRAVDGIDLRYRFGYEHKYTGNTITEYLDNGPCSVLEMLIALAMRCEEHIMDDPEIGNRTGQWFWNMVVNLGLGAMNDNNFDKRHVDFVILRFLNRDYERNGEGGLFTIDDCRDDLRNVEIWYQMCWYLGSIM